MFGRDGELASLWDAAQTLGTGGRAVLVEGPPGIGKTTLLAALADKAGAAGLRVLRASGIEGGTSSGFTGLHEVLHPVLHLVDAVPERQRAALLTAFGMTDGTVSDRLLIDLATLSLLEEAAGTCPLLLLVEDAHWLDRSTVEVLAFVARRLTTVPALVVVTVRSDERLDNSLEELDLPRLVLEPLDAETSARLIRQQHPEVPDDLLRQVLIEAGGNPLALAEFATTAAARNTSPRSPLLGPLPTTRRLEQAFLAGLDRLPVASRRLLLLASATLDLSLATLLSAGAGLGVAEADVQAVERSGLATVTGGSLTFRHPLVRSAVYGAAPYPERIAVHGALADVAPRLGDAVWHRALATTERDESVAASLEQVADSHRRRGAHLEAVTALRRAAALSPAQDDRARRLALAAESARHAGAVEECRALLRDALPLAEAPDVIRLLSGTEVMLSVATGSRGRSAEDCIVDARRLDRASGSDRMPERSALLLGASSRMWVMGASDASRQRMRTALIGLGELGEDWLQLLALAHVDPVLAAPHLVDLLPALAEHATGQAPPGRDGVSHQMRLLLTIGHAAECVQDLPTARRVWDRSLRVAQAAGAVTDEAFSLAGRSLHHVLAGDTAAAMRDGSRLTELATSLGLPVLAGHGHAAAAHVHALRGEHAQASAAVERIRGLTAHGPAAIVSAHVHWAAGLVALNDGRNHDALHELRSVVVHPSTAQWAVADLVEAAVRCARGTEALPVLAEVEAFAQAVPGRFLRALTHRARALLTAGDDAAEEFERSLAAGADGGNPVELARTHLAYGEWLRRRRRIRAAREHLVQARDGFITVGARPLSDRATAELRATGVRSAAPAADSREHVLGSLTAQELQVAHLAAAGLTNQQIADQLYLSPRTVAHHLFNAFPKLGIDHRAQLSDVLPRFTA